MASFTQPFIFRSRKVDTFFIKNFSTGCPKHKAKKDLYYADKLPVYTYNKINERKLRMYVFGCARHGGIGLERLIRPKSDQKTHFFMWKPVRHEFAEFHEVTHVAAGHGFSLVAVKPKTNNFPIVFGTGNNSYSQLSYQSARENKPMETLLGFVPLPFLRKREDRVAALGAGSSHSLISIHNEGLYTLGDNSEGQCGRRIINDEEYFGSKYIHKHPSFQGDNQVVQIAAKHHLSVCLTASGQVYTFGSNLRGQLGRGKVVERPWVPEPVAGDLAGENVKQVVSSGASVLAISDKGELFGWGCNEAGQCDFNNIPEISFYPKRIKLPSKIGKVLDVAIGDHFSYVLNEQGEVYVWGQGKYLGLGPSTRLVRRPALMPPPLFGCNELNSDVRVSSISASFHHSAAINTQGDLFTWGKSVQGSLGLGDLQQQFFPLRVSLGASARRISLGYDHNILLAKAL